MNKCKHLKVRQTFLKTRNRYEHYICPDCDKPIVCEQPIAKEDYQFTPKPSFNIARFSMAGVGDYWKKI